MEPCKSFLGPFHLAHRSAGPDLGRQRVRRARDALSGRRSEQGRELLVRMERQRSGHRQPGQCLGHQPVRQCLAGMFHLADMVCGLKLGGVGPAIGLLDEDHVQADRADRRRRQRHALAAGRHANIRARHSRVAGSPGRGQWPMDGNDNAWISNFAMPRQPDRGAVRRRAPRTARPGFKTGDQISPPGRLRWRRPADADRHCRSTRPAMSGR